jgi:hypothetical protein
MISVQEHLSRIPTQAQGVASRLVDGVAIALTERDQTLHTFEGPVSSHIWMLIDGRRTLAQIVEDIQSTFEVDAQKAQDDLLQFMQLLQDRGLVAVAVTP